MKHTGAQQPDEIRQWISRSIEGDRSAQYALYKQYSKAMYNISYRITNDEDEAKDVLQEAFISAFQNLKSYRGDSSFGAWLKKIVVNQAINQARKRKLMIQPLEDRNDYPDEADGIDEDNLLLNVERIRDAIRELPDGFRMVFTLYLMEGYDHGEIAGILGISESTSKTQYIRAKKRIKEILKERIRSNG
jgi:RNA polymerase sigma factor (sigma-70 family)